MELLISKRILSEGAVGVLDQVKAAEGPSSTN